jgi:uncharacterized protein YeaC (DUF1315 family)
MKLDLFLVTGTIAIAVLLSLTVLTPTAIVANSDDIKLAEQSTQAAATSNQIEAILTTEQRQQLKTAIEQGKDPQVIWERLQLSADQKTQLQKLRSAHPSPPPEEPLPLQLGQPHPGTILYPNPTNHLIDAILTPGQRDQLRSAIEQGQSPRNALENLPLSTEQKTQLQQLRLSPPEQRK